MAGYKVITDAVREEGKKWWGLSDDVKPISEKVKGMTLGVTAFFVGDPFVLGLQFDATLHYNAYEGYRHFVETVLSGSSDPNAVTEFDELGNALKKIAEAYDRAEEVATVDLNKIYAK